MYPPPVSPTPSPPHISQLPPHPPQYQPQPLVKMENVQRKLPSYTFKTLNTQPPRAVDNRLPLSPPNNYLGSSSSRHNSYPELQNNKDLDTTFNPNQFDSTAFSRTYDSVVTLRGTSDQKNSYSPSTPGFPETDTQKFFSKYVEPTIQQRAISSSYVARQSNDLYFSQSSQKRESTVSGELNQIKKEQEFPSMSKGNFMQTYYESVVERSKLSDLMPKKTVSYAALSYMEEKEFKDKIASLTQELTKNSMEKGELLLQVSQLRQQNKSLTEENKLLNEEKRILSGSSDIISELKDEIQKERKEKQQYALTIKEMKIEKEGFQTEIELLKKQIEQYKEKEEVRPKGGIWIDEDILQEIQAIKQRQVETNKLKQQFMAILDNKYQEEIKRINDQNHHLKTELQSCQFDLKMAKDSAKQKQLKLDYMQKQTQAIESKSRAQSRNIKEQLDSELREKSTEIIALKHALHSLEVKYKAQRKELTDKDDFIAKYLAGRGGEDAETYQILIDKYNFYSKQQFEQISYSSTPRTPISK